MKNEMGKRKNARQTDDANVREENKSAKICKEIVQSYFLRLLSVLLLVDPLGTVLESVVTGFSQSQRFG